MFNDPVALTILSIYGFLLTIILVYSLVQWDVLRNYTKKYKHPQLEVFRDEELPFVTIQLPVFNEQYVVVDLLECVSQLDYPKDKFEIQFLDDSTDESVEIAAEKIKELQGRGIQIEQIFRPERKGFKAGALAYGLERAKGEFIAIFDADFLPEKDFLRKALPGFRDPEIGVVQGRWGHLNRNYSLLTRLQAFGLDAHFTVEQGGRSSGGHFINFNGTAGIWRKSCIEDAGGWSAQTLTEDLDLSYRAQLKGWKFLFLEDLVVPAELPMAMNALKNQQFRWTKGAAQCALKNGKRIFSSDLSLKSKIHGIAHLMNSSIFVVIVMCGLLSVPILEIKMNHPQWDWVFKIGMVFLLSFFILLAIYWTSEKKTNPTPFPRFFTRFVCFLAVSMGLSLHNSKAVLEAWVNKKSPFVRTPKFNMGKTGTWTKNKYLVSTIDGLNILELLFFLIFCWAIFRGIQIGEHGLLFFHLMLAFGFGFVAFKSISHSVRGRG